MLISKGLPRRPNLVQVQYTTTLCLEMIPTYFERRWLSEGHHICVDEDSSRKYRVVNRMAYLLCVTFILWASECSAQSLPCNASTILGFSHPHAAGTCFHRQLTQMAFRVLWMHPFHIMTKRQKCFSRMAFRHRICLDYVHQRTPTDE